MKLHQGLIYAAVCSVAFVATSAHAQLLPPFETATREAAIVDSSAQTLNEVMSIPARGIPRTLLADAQGLVIVPGVLKGGFVIGVERGHGVVVVRDEAGRWQLPQFVTITGGSIGWQAGLQATDLVLVFKTKKSVTGLLSGKFTVGVDATAAAGPVGRSASAATDAKLQAEIYSYSRSRGLFAGFSVDGAKINIDRNAAAVYYRPTVAVPPGQAAPLPGSALRLMQTVAFYTTNVVEPPASAATNPAPANETPTAAGALVPIAVAPQPAVDTQQLRAELAAASNRLGGLVDPAWQSYLALPPEIYVGNTLPSREALLQSLAKFQSIAAHPQYSALSTRPEFAETQQLLQRMIDAVPAPSLNLPPPPGQ
ncbi:MAG: lipid-binding SYLF domain-containing protein [Planctomycetes bacterium]|nr:lipid-binding SYLF domain-containing protein [Planctomycetota bacterium]